MMKQICSLSLVAAFVMLPRLAAPHHSMAEWDTSVIDEMQGEIVSVVWRNPHIRWTMRIENEAGEGELWTMAGTSPNHLTRRGVTADTLKVGEVIRVAGSPSTRRPLNFIVNSALLPDRTEVLLRGLGPAAPVAHARSRSGTGDLERGRQLGGPVRAPRDAVDDGQSLSARVRQRR